MPASDYTSIKNINNFKKSRCLPPSLDKFPPLTLNLPPRFCHLSRPPTAPCLSRPPHEAVHSFIHSFGMSGVPGTQLITKGS